MSDTFMPASSSARLAACAFKPRPDMCGTRPISDSPTPTMATLFFRDAAVFMRPSLCGDAGELRDHGAFASILKRNLDPVADLNLQGVVAEQVGHHAGAFIQLYQCDDVWH